MEISLENCQFFPHPVYLMLQLKGFPLELGIAARGQKVQMMGYQMVEKVLRWV